MGSFINSLILRHLEAGNKVKPRLRSRYEPPLIPSPAVEQGFESFRGSWERREPVVDEGNNSVYNPRTNTSSSQEKSQHSTGAATSAANWGNELSSPEKAPDQEPWTVKGEADFSSEKDPTRILKEDHITSVIKPYRDKREQLREIAVQQEQKPLSKMAGSILTNSDKTVEAEGSARITPAEHGLKKENLNRETGDAPHSGAGKSESRAERQETAGSIIPKKRGTLGEPPAIAFSNLQKYQKRLSENDRPNEIQPEIRVTIGQINVRAVTQTSLPDKKSAVVPRPSLSLDEYLKQRDKR